jgi:hypothetical protein
MWTVRQNDDYIRRKKTFEKKRPRELMAVLDNLDTVLKSLNGGLKLEQVRTFGFAHHEPQGVLAVDQKGGGHGTKLAQTRLYVYANPKTQVMDLITIGDKGSQERDIQTCKEFMQELLEKESTPHEQE